MREYNVGDVVEVSMPDGWMVGKIAEKSKLFSASGEIKYLINGIDHKKPFTTIASARVIREA